MVLLRLLFIIFLLFAQSVSAADYYVSHAGAGSKDGTLNNSWESVPSAGGWAAMTGGDTLHIMDCIHAILAWPITASGIENTYLTISGSGYSNAGLALGIEKVSTSWSAGPDAFGAYSISYNAGTGWASEWTTANGPCASSTKLTDAGKVPDETWVAGNYYYDSSSGNTYWKPTGDGTKTGKTVTFYSLPVIDVSGVNWVKITDLVTKFSAYDIGRTSASNYIWLNNITINQAKGSLIKVNADRNITGSDNGKITNCTISTAQNGIYLMSGGDEYNNDNWTISNNTISNMVELSGDGHGIGVQCGSNNIIENNTIYNCNTGITMWCGTDTIMNNNTIRYNYIYNMDGARGDGRGQGIGWEGTNTTAASMTGNTTVYNIINGCSSTGGYDGAGGGIRPKFVDAGNLTANNTVYGCEPNYFLQAVGTSAMGGVLENNISFEPTGNHIYVASTVGGYTGLTIDYNSYYEDTGTLFSWQGTGHNFTDWKAHLTTASIIGADAHSITTDPTLTGAGTYSTALSFKPLVGSPAINAGVDVGLTKDYLGRTISGLPDIGAFEYIAYPYLPFRIP